MTALPSQNPHEAFKEWFRSISTPNSSGPYRRRKTGFQTTFRDSRTQLSTNNVQAKGVANEGKII